MALVATSCGFLAPAAANADEHWVVNATFTDGGTLTGFIDFNVYGSLGAYDLVTSPVGGFPGFEFRPGHGNISGGLFGPGDTSLTLLGPAYNSDILVLTASSSFLVSQNGNYLQASSAECVGLYSCSPGAGTRYLSGASLMAVPEPAAWALMTIGFGGIGAAARRRRTAVAA